MSARRQQPRPARAGVSAVAGELGRNRLFGLLDDAALDELARRVQQRTLAKNELLWAQGSRPDALALVRSGRLDVVRLTRRGDRLLLNILGAGELVGLSVIAGQPHSGDIVAANRARLLLVPGAALRALLAARPQLALHALAELGALLEHATDELEALRCADLAARLQRALARLGRGRREIAITHQELAELVGATRANVSRVLRRFERRGALLRRRGRVELLDLSRVVSDGD